MQGLNKLIFQTGAFTDVPVSAVLIINKCQVSQNYYVNYMFLFIELQCYCEDTVVLQLLCTHSFRSCFKTLW